LIRTNPSTTMLLAAVPYLLLSMSQDVTFTTIVQHDGSGLRQFVASCLENRKEDVTKRIREASPHYDVEHCQIGPGQITIIRNWRPTGLDKLTEKGVSLQITDIAQQPLSLFTYYDWSEQIQIHRDTATEVEKEGQQKAVLRYILQMPGTILPQTLSTGGQVENDRAVWELTGDEEQYTLKAQSRKVRWGYLLILIYVLGFIIFQLVSYTERRIKNRPRRI